MDFYADEEVAFYPRYCSPLTAPLQWFLQTAPRRISNFLQAFYYLPLGIIKLSTADHTLKQNIMDILKAATDWAKAELFSTPFFILFGVVFMAASLGFWQLGKTDMARAYIIPTLVAGVLLLTIGLGLFFTNKARITAFETAYQADAAAFVTSEITRAESTLKEYKTIVFKAIPMIIIAAALLILFINTPTWRAIGITTIAMMVVILLIDGTAHARVEAYKKLLDAAHIHFNS